MASSSGSLSTGIGANAIRTTAPGGLAPCPVEAPGHRGLAAPQGTESGTPTSTGTGAINEAGTMAASRGTTIDSATGGSTTVEVGVFDASGSNGTFQTNTVVHTISGAWGITMSADVSPGSEGQLGERARQARLGGVALRGRRRGAGD